MRTVVENGKMRKHEYRKGEKGYSPTKMTMDVILGKGIKSHVIAYDFIKNEYTAYLRDINIIKSLGVNVSNLGAEDCILFALKYNNTTKTSRVKKYFKGNYLNVETNDIIFHTGIYEDTGEYTLYVFEEQTPEDVELGFSKQAYATYYGRTFTKDGEFIRESRYYNE